MVAVYSKPKQGSTVRAGLEVYRTDEDNFKPYVSSGVVQDTKTNSENDSEKTGFTYHQGDILDTYYYGNLESVSHEYDYSDMSDNASLKMQKVDKNRYYKGVRVSIRKEWEAPEKTLSWEHDLKPVIDGFITEQTFSESGVEIKVNGYSKLLDQKFLFNFTNMKRSEILKEIIKTAGLVPVVDAKGLDDDVTNFTNKSSSNSSTNSELTGGEGETIDSLVKKIVGSETDELAKAKLIHGWLQENVKYSGYPCTRYNTPEKCLKNKTRLNCADTARLTRAMMASAGLKCYVVHRTTNGGHFWVIIEIGGKKYASDQTGSGSAFNTVWANSGRTTVSDGGSYTRKNGKNPDC